MPAFKIVLRSLLALFDQSNFKASSFIPNSGTIDKEANR
jgi:hypothetical protein